MTSPTETAIVFVVRYPLDGTLVVALTFDELNESLRSHIGDGHVRADLYIADLADRLPKP